MGKDDRRLPIGSPWTGDRDSVKWGLVTVALVLATVLSLLVGLSLGFLGGGGSILAVPLLVFVAGLPPAEAIGMSLALVGTTSLMAALLHFRSGNVDIKAASIFGGIGAAGSWAGSLLTPQVPASTLMLLFSGVLAAAGLRMAIPGQRVSGAEKAVEVAWLPLALSGLGVGALTGFLGVGGGFLIVPALVLFGGLTMNRAVGTSLVVISTNCFAGFLSHAGDRPLRLGLAGLFTAAAVAGAIVGERLSGRLEPATLRRAFGLFVLSVAVLSVLGTVW